MRLARLLFFFCLPLTLSAQKLTIGPTPARPTVSGTYNLSRNATTGLFELTPYTGSPFIMPVDTAQIKGWVGVKGLFRPYNWVPGISDVTGLNARLSGIDTYAAGVAALIPPINTRLTNIDGFITGLQESKANVSTVSFLEQDVFRIDTALANRATKAELQALVTPTGDSATTAYPRSTVDYLLGQKVSTTAQTSALALKTDVSRSRKTVTPQAFGGSATANFVNTTAVNAALSELNAAGGGTLYYPPGRYVQGPVQIPGSKIAIVADPGSVTIVRTTTRGPAFYWAADNVTLSGLTINSDSASFEGPVYFSGSNCLISRVQGLYGDATSFVVSSKIFNGSGATRTTTNNRVEFCYAKGQKRYHDVAGTSPFIAGDYATNTTFYACTVEDCYNADAFDSDNSNGTIFENCVARSNGSLTGLTAFWCEGEQTDNDHTAKFINCTAINYLNAFAAGERAKIIIEGGQAISCTRAFQGLNNIFRAYVSDVTATSCGTGTSTLTEGIFMSYGAATFTRCNTRSSASGVNAVCNYSGSAFYDRFVVDGGEFDRSIRVAYGTGGCQTVEINRARLLSGGLLLYDNGQNHTLYVDGLIMEDGAVIGSRIKRAIYRNCRFTSSDTGRTHFNLLTDNFNTYIETSEFNGGLQVVESGKATIGPANRAYGVVNGAP